MVKLWLGNKDSNLDKRSQSPFYYLSSIIINPCCLINKCYRKKSEWRERCLKKDVTEVGQSF